MPGECLTSVGIEHVYYTTILGLTTSASELSFNAEEQDEMIKACNELALRMLSRTKRVASMTALVQMLIKSETVSNPRLSLEGDDEPSLAPAEVSPKGCLIVCKLIEKTIRRERKKTKPFEQLELAPLLLACAEFLEISRIESDDKERAGLRTIKLILKNISDSIGNDILHHTTNISPNSAIFKLLPTFGVSCAAVVSPLSAAASFSTFSPSTEAERGTDSNHTTSGSGGSVGGSLQAELTTVFEKLIQNRVHPEIAELGFIELYNFQQRHPEVSMEGHLANVSLEFREEIDTQMQKVAANKFNPLNATSSVLPSAVSSATSMAAIRARLSSSSSASSSVSSSVSSSAPPAPSNNSSEVLAAPPTSTTSSTKQPLDLNQLRARLNKMKQ